jgi:hypothetical protein
MYSMKRVDYINNDEAPKFVAENKLVVWEGVKPESGVDIQSEITPSPEVGEMREMLYNNFVLRSAGYFGPTLPGTIVSGSPFRLSYSNTADPSEDMASINASRNSPYDPFIINRPNTVEEDDGF